MDKQTLNNKSIYELRIIGRELGVKKPTTLKKQTLIKAILDMQLGKDKPTFSNRGRPPITNKIENENSQTVKNEIITKIDKILENAKKDILQILNYLL